MTKISQKEMRAEEKTGQKREREREREQFLNMCFWGRKEAIYIRRNEARQKSLVKRASGVYLRMQRNISELYTATARVCI